MSTIAIERAGTRCPATSVLWAAALATVMLASWTLAVCVPLGFSLVIVFLFAGPHNWFEARYFLTKMPARWGKLRPYFLIGLAGAPTLAVFSASLPWQAAWWSWDHGAWQWAIAAWNTAMVVWVLAMATLRSRQNPRRDWAWLWPVGLMLMGVNWLWPFAWSLALVYLHPLVSLWFLDRELARRDPARGRIYRTVLYALPVLCGLLIWQLASAVDLPGEDLLTQQITHHAGASILPNVSSHMLVSLHTFLEMLHYAVWIFAMPLVGLSSVPWKLSDVPLAKKSPLWARGVVGVLLLGMLVVVGFWMAFLADYPAARDLYFTVALLHVLAEAPFLLRLL